MKNYVDQRHRWNRSERGFSLVEAIVAIAVLSIGVLSLARLVPFATRTDYVARTDSTATFIAMRMMEQMLAQPWNTTRFIDAADDSGDTTADMAGNDGMGVNIDCVCTPQGNCPQDEGASFVAGTETIDFSATREDGYWRTYRINASPAPGTVKVNQGVYDVRWNITCDKYGTGGIPNGAGLLKITVAARPVGNVPGMIAIPAHVRAVKTK